MAGIERCVRCGTGVVVEDCACWEPVSDEHGARLAPVCESCLTDAERRDLDDEADTGWGDEYVGGERGPSSVLGGGDFDRLTRGDPRWVIRDLRFGAPRRGPEPRRIRDDDR